jgi:hypothetical protein
LSAGLVTTATAGLMLLGGGTAQAAGGGLTFIPGKGMDISPMYTVTSAPCPKTATNVVGRIFGKGFDSKGLVVIQNSDAAIRHDVAFGVPLQDTIAGFAQTAGVKLKGKYKIEVQCVNELATKVFATFTGTINFSDATHFTGPTPKIPPAEGVPTGFLAQVFPEFKAGNPPKAQASGGAKPSASGPAAPVDGSAAAASAAAAASGTALKPAGDSSLKPFAIIIVGIALLGAVGFIATRPRPATAGAVTGPRAAGGPAPVEWPDESETASPSSIFFAEPEAAPTGVLPQPAEAALVVGETTAEESVATESPATEAATETVAGESVSTPSVTAASPVVAGVKPSESAVAGVNPVATEPAKIAAAEMESTAPATAPAPTIPDAQTPSPEQASSEQGSPERAATQQPTPEQSTPPETPTNPRSPAPRSLRGRPVPRVIADQPVSTGPGRTP